MNRNISALTGLRFFAAFGIVLHHADKGMFFKDDLFHPFSLKAAVPLFFALSGFVLTINADKYTNIPDFYAARIARIWPAHLAAIGLLILAFYPYSLVLFQGPWLHSSLATVFLMQAWLPQDFYSLNSPSWSISVELFFYAIFPYIYVHMQKRYLTKASGSFLGAIALCAIAPYLVDISSDLYTWLIYINPIINLPTFILGIASGMAYKEYKSNPRNGTLFQILAVLSIVLALGLAGIAMSEFNSLLSEYLSISIAAPTFAFLLFSLAVYRGVVSKILSIPIIVYLGEISYSLYLVHQIVFRWWADRKYLFSDFPMWAQFAGAVVVSLVISALFFKFIEGPSRQLILSCWRKLRTLAQSGLS